MRKLQTLGGMQGHQLHGISVLLVIIALQDIHQRQPGNDVGDAF